MVITRHVNFEQVLHFYYFKCFNYVTSITLFLGIDILVV